MALTRTTGPGPCRRSAPPTRASFLWVSPPGCTGPIERDGRSPAITPGNCSTARLYEAGLATRPESLAADDGLELKHARIVNSVKCVPPGNKPLPDEIRGCNAYLKAELASLKRVRVVLALGRVGHDAFLMASGLKRSQFPFGHGREHRSTRRGTSSTRIIAAATTPRPGCSPSRCSGRSWRAPASLRAFADSRTAARGRSSGADDLY